jgi:hypothetical protein
MYLPTIVSSDRLRRVEHDLCQAALGRIASLIRPAFDFRYGQVYRWAYDYSVPGAEQDFVPQTQRAVARAA